MVVGAEPAVPSVQGGRALELLEEELTRLALAGSRRVDVEVRELVSRLGADVARGHREVPRQPAFVGHVPGLDVAPVDVAGIGRAHVRRGRQVHRARAQVGSSEERDA